MNAHTLIDFGLKYLEGNISGSIGVGSLWKYTDFTFPQRRNACFIIFWNYTIKIC